MDSDSNLLYGLLVRLFDFVPLAELHSALQASLAAPPRPLAQVLGERALLAADQRAALDGLLREYLALHAGDPVRGLAALGNSRAMQSALDGLLRPPATPGAEANLTLPQASTTLLAESSYTDPGDDLGPASERFRILRTHAKGGLGEVFVAHDEELRREVALKRLHDHHADAPDTRARFVLEAEVTGGLEHPGIVPVYSLGRSAEGRPYYAMRFIRGDSLKQAIDRYHQAEFSSPDPGEHALELRKLLGRFLDVCNAVEYAHSRGVIHRDLKPDNIMLGMFGETLVVDWGLAKHLGHAAPGEGEGLPPLELIPGEDTARTQVGSAIGTPAYMSPEQAAGRLGELGPASDIYSLGATLYYLLTGRPPFEAPGLLQLLLRVQDGDFPLPREVKPSVPTALEAICLKAMALAPAQRYPTCIALAEDLERWLADEPVSVHQPEWHERLARWGRRHRRSVEAAAAALAAITLISIVAFVLVHGAKQEVERERDEVQNALAAETAAKRQAHTALEAEREAKREARLAIDDYVKLVSEDHDLKDEQVQPLRQQMLEDARRSYRQLLDKNGRDAHVRQDLAAAILRIGRINHASGSKQEAIEAFQEARDAFQKLVDEHPESAQYLSDLALSFRSLGVLEGEAGHSETALAHFARALSIERRLVAEHPKKVDYLRDLGLCCHHFAAQEVQANRMQAAAKRVAEALKIREALVQSHPDRAGYQFDLAESWRLLGEVQSRQSQVDAAIESFGKAAEIARRVLAAAPRTRIYRRGLSGCYRDLSAAHLQQGELAPALAAALKDKGLWPAEPDELFVAACNLASCAQGASDSEDDRQLAAQAARETKQTLQAAISAGFRDRTLFEQQPELAAALGEADYQAALEQLDAAGAAEPKAP